jgi:uncharacterized protein (DUF58 family)
VGRALLAAFRAVTRFGWTTLAVGGVLGAAGWLGDWPEALAPGAALVVAVLFGFLASLGQSSFTVTVEIPWRRVTVGQVAFGSVRVTNRGRRRSLPAVIELPIGNQTQHGRLPSLPPGGVFEHRFQVDTSRRAVVTVGPVRSARGDPLGLVRRSVAWSGQDDVYVRPRTVFLDTVSAGLLRDLEGKATTDRADSDLSFHTLREYLPGDDRRHIDWKSTARVSTLMVRQFEDTRRVRLGLGLADGALERHDPAGFELAVAAFASTALLGIREGFEVTALAGDRVLRSQDPLLLLDECCALQASADGSGIVTMAKRLARRAPGATLMMLFGGAVAGGPMREAARSLPQGVRAIALRALPGAAPELRSVQAMSSMTAGQLEDLPRLLSRAARSGR